MRIGINGERLLITNPAGPEKYTLNLIHALALVDKDNEYVVYFNQTPSQVFLDNLFSGNSKFTYKVLKKFISWTQVSLALELLVHPVDTFFTAVHTVPFFRFVSIVSMIHGLEYTYASKSPLAVLPVWFTALVSKKIIVPSQHTKKQLLLKKWVPESKINIISEGVSSEFYKRPDGPKDYLLFVSTIEPRKNIFKLIQAFSLVSSTHPQLKLYIVGKKGWDYEHVLVAPEKFGVKDRVEFLGRVSDEYLPVLFSGALAFVSASLEEGFGLPLLEAMASETPCVVSNIEAFKSLGKDFITYFDPNNVNDIAAQINEVLENRPSEERLKEMGTYAKGFTWEKTATETLIVLRGPSF